jgi:hypothetical protein
VKQLFLEILIQKSTNAIKYDIIYVMRIIFHFITTSVISTLILLLIVTGLVSIQEDRLLAYQSGEIEQNHTGVSMLLAQANIGEVIVIVENQNHSELKKDEQDEQQEIKIQTYQKTEQYSTEEKDNEAQLSPLFKEKEISKEKKSVSLGVKKKYNADTQFVMISFDGSRSLPTWNKTLSFAEEMRALGSQLDFTYFISGVYFLPKENKKTYSLSWRKPGSSGISFGDTKEVTDERIRLVNKAYSSGHEIGSHLNGHFDGSSWTEDQWDEEFDFFSKIMTNDFTPLINRGLDIEVPIEDILGIRSPLLSKNKALYKTLAKKNFSYDTSKVAYAGTQPWKDQNDIWQFPLVSLRLNGKYTLSMDYNHYEAQTGAKNLLKAGTPEWNKAKDDIVNLYIEYFETEYNGVKAPVNIGHHFSMWNDGVYWEALKEFMRQVCHKEDVACANYSDLVEFLENK